MKSSTIARHQDYTIHKIKDETMVDKTEFAELVIKLLKPYDDSVESTHDAVDNAIRHGHAYIATKDERPVAVCIVVNFRLNGFIPTHHMAYLGVDKAHRRKGLAKKLVDLSLKDSGGEMSLHVDLDNEDAMVFYEKMGYKRLYHRFLIGREH